LADIVNMLGTKEEEAIFEVSESVMSGRVILVVQLPRARTYLPRLVSDCNIEFS
jgi:hypothetical protein